MMLGKLPLEKLGPEEKVKRAGQSVAQGRRIGRLARVEAEKIEEGAVFGFRIALFIRTTLAGDPLRSHDSTDTRAIRSRVRETDLFLERRSRGQMLREMNRENIQVLYTLDSSWKRKIKSFLRDNFPSIRPHNLSNLIL